MRRPLRLCLALALCFVLALWQFNALPSIAASLPNLAGSSLSVHPVAAAVSAAEQHFIKLLTRESATLAAATEEYRRRYDLDPPPNFDKWFQLAQQNEFVLIDEFDTIMASLAPFRALPAKQLQQLLDLALKELPDQLLKYEIRGGQFSAVLQSGPSWFANNMHGFLPLEWLSLVPDMTLAINIKDEPQVVIPRPMLDQLMSRAEVKDLGPEFDKPFQVIAREDPWPFVSGGCPPSECRTPSEEGIEVITNLTASQDICAHCSIHQQEGILLSPARVSLTHLPIPILSQAKPSVFNDVLFPSPHYWGIASHERPDLRRWTDKKSQLYWTGSATGGFASEENWQQMQRQKLALKYKQGSSEAARLLQQNPSGDWLPYNTTTDEIKDIVNIRITGTTAQCEEKVCEQEKEAFGIEGKRDPEDRVMAYKFVLDVDGNSFSGRFHRLLRTNSLVFKKSIFQEWHQDRLIPWVHYIPISSNGDELPEVTRFFARTEEGELLARKIALNSKDWAEKSLRHVDMQLVLLRILLEMGRILNG